MEKFYITDIRTLPDPKDKPSVIEDLPVKRQKKCLRYINAEDRKRSLGAGIIIKTILKDFDCKKNIIEGKNGKPESDGIFFNVSHSGNYVIGVAADMPIGCDIEEIATAPLKIADRCFCKSEKDYIMGHADKNFAFWQMWTLKESYMKMTGEGLKLRLNKFKVTVNDKIIVYRDGEPQNCTLKHFTHDGHSIAICKNKTS